MSLPCCGVFSRLAYYATTEKSHCRMLKPSLTFRFYDDYRAVLRSQMTRTVSRARAMKYQIDIDFHMQCSFSSPKSALLRGGPGPTSPTWKFSIENKVPSNYFRRAASVSIRSRARELQTPAGSLDTVSVGARRERHLVKHGTKTFGSNATYG